MNVVTEMEKLRLSTLTHLGRPSMNHKVTIYVLLCVLGAVSGTMYSYAQDVKVLRETVSGQRIQIQALKGASVDAQCVKWLFDANLLTVRNRLCRGNLK